MVKTLNKLIITRWNGRILTALMEQDLLMELNLDEEDSILGNIYIGKVQSVVKNINAAFVDFCEGKTGYYSLAENPVSLSASGASGSVLRAGDEIIVQVAKDAIKTKDPVLTANLTFSGKYTVLTAGKPSIGFSAKISDKEWKARLKPQLEALTANEAGLIVRTNAYQAQPEAILAEAEALLGEYRALLQAARFRTCYSCLYQAQPGYMGSINSCPSHTLSEIITDDPTILETLSSLSRSGVLDPDIAIRLYQDPLLPLSSLYALNTAIEQACQKRVWLKSGGYLIIEPTEAMVVIDVNTGKYSGRKNQEETIRKINLEAAKEICRQLRLRNLSGIIMIDFIDMKAQEDRQLLLDTMRSHARKDPVKTTVIDMTALNLMELTRKKGRRPLFEQLGKARMNEKTGGEGV